MKTIGFTRASLRSAFMLAALALSFLPLAAKEPKLTADVLVAKHLASIGTPQAIAEIHSRAVGGAAQVVFRLPNPGQTTGKGVLLSDGKKVAINMAFAAIDFPEEHFAFDGNQVTAGFVRTGQRSLLGSFVYRFDVLLKEGLLGGTMTTAWALLDVPGRQPKLDYTGLKKFEGRQLHELKYRAKKWSGDLTVSLYFDPETFRHLYTKIRMSQPIDLGKQPGEAAIARELVHTLVESYDDFRVEGSLTIPHSYKLVETLEGQDASVIREYRITADQVADNQTLDAKLFSVQ